MFLLLLFQNPEFSVRHNESLQLELDKELKKERSEHKKALHSELQKFSNAIKEHFEKISLLLLKGAHISNNSYYKIRLLLSFDLNKETGIVKRSKLPSIASDSIQSMYMRKKRREEKRREEKRREEKRRWNSLVFLCTLLIFSDAR
jgi:hypothetical protein